MQFADLSYAHKLLAGFGLSTVVLQLFLIACQNVLKARSHYVSVFLHAYIAYECRKSANTFLKGGKNQCVCGQQRTICTTRRKFQVTLKVMLDKHKQRCGDYLTVAFYHLFLSNLWQVIHFSQQQYHYCLGPWQLLFSKYGIRCCACLTWLTPMDDLSELPSVVPIWDQLISITDFINEWVKKGTCNCYCVSSVTWRLKVTKSSFNMCNENFSPNHANKG